MPHDQIRKINTALDVCTAQGAIQSISGVSTHVIKLGPWLQLATRDKQQQQAKHEPVSQYHSSKLAAHHTDHRK